MSPSSRLILPVNLLNNCALNSDGTTGYEKEIFGSNDFALEPCNKNSSHGRLSNQMPIIIQTLPNPNATCHQRKRKLEQSMNGHKLATTLELITREKCDNQNGNGMLNDKAEEYCSICRQDYTQLGDMDGFMEGPNPVQQGYLKNYPKDVVTSCNYTNSIETSLESLANENFQDSSEASHSSISKNEDNELNLDENNLSSEDNDTQRPAIPIGPRFQAEVPKWEGPTTNIRHDAKWLGIQLWPLPCISESNTKGIGEGKLDSCACEFPGSVDCVKLHIGEARDLLKLEIGTTFSSWKFDEMGEDVSKSWAFEEQKKFESLVKLNLASNGTNLWKLAIKHFPSKSLKCMVNYYHNVYIPRRLSMETRSSSYDVVYSDNDENEDLNSKNNYSSTGRSWLR